MPARRPTFFAGRTSFANLSPTYKISLGGSLDNSTGAFFALTTALVLSMTSLIVFSALYNSIDEKGYSDYRDLAEKLKLTESSIRDYIGKLIKKEIPIEKIKLNNKNIQLKISENLKKIASLSTILHLREI